MWLTGTQILKSIHPSPRHFLAVAVVFAALLTSCGKEPTGRPSFSDRLELRLGRNLSPAEVVRYKDTAELLCTLQDNVLVEIWTQLDADDLDFHTFVFTEECPEREAFYRSIRLDPDRYDDSDPTTATPEAEPTPATENTSPDASTPTSIPTEVEE